LSFYSCLQQQFIHLVFWEKTMNQISSWNHLDIMVGCNLLQGDPQKSRPDFHLVPAAKCMQITQNLIYRYIFLIRNFSPFSFFCDTLYLAYIIQYIFVCPCRISYSPFLRADFALLNEVLNLQPKEFTEIDAMKKFFWLIAFPVQGVCRY
jgi:hypothetical protein